MLLARVARAVFITGAFTVSIDFVEMIFFLLGRDSS